MLAIDAGNSRTKWGVFDAGGALLSHGAVDNQQIAALLDQGLNLRACRRAVLSNVAGAAIGGQLHELCRQLDLPLTTLTASPLACGVRNNYLRPEQLGSDRWAALIAAWSRDPAPCVVVMAGTALTVDALSSGGEFVGGLIMPGWRMMQAALSQGTAGLNKDEGRFEAFPRTTANAMHTGAWLAMAGAVEKMRDRLAAGERQTIRTVLSGGDAAGLQAALSCPAEIVDNLVLEGLWRIAEEGA